MRVGKEGPAAGIFLSRAFFEVNAREIVIAYGSLGRGCSWLVSGARIDHISRLTCSRLLTVGCMLGVSIEISNEDGDLGRNTGSVKMTHCRFLIFELLEALVFEVISDIEYFQNINNC